MPPLFKVGTQCGNSARWGLYGGRRVIGVPTVTGIGIIVFGFELFIGEHRQLVSEIGWHVMTQMPQIKLFV